MKDDHDADYKLLFSNPEMLRDLLTGLVLKECLKDADFLTLIRLTAETLCNPAPPRSDKTEWLAEEETRSMRRALMIWIKRLLHVQLSDAVIDDINDLQKVPSTLAEDIKNWFENYENGRQEGEALALQRLLSLRFGALPAEVIDQIASAPLEQIEIWFDAAINAQQLTDVFSAS